MTPTLAPSPPWGPYQCYRHPVAEIMEAAERGEALDLPVVGGQLLPPILFADDTALLATLAAGLQRQLDLMERYRARKRLRTSQYIASGPRYIPVHCLGASVHRCTCGNTA